MLTSTRKFFGSAAALSIILTALSPAISAAQSIPPQVDEDEVVAISTTNWFAPAPVESEIKIEVNPLAAIVRTEKSLMKEPARVGFKVERVKPGWTNPLPSHCLSQRDYGEHFHPILHEWRMHYGVDIPAGSGVPILAAAAGVATTGSDSGAGNNILIRHNDGTYTSYQHLSQFKVSSGQQVNAGDVIGYVGSTGRSTGPHLHFETRLDRNTRTDPIPFMSARGVQLRYC